MLKVTCGGDSQNNHKMAAFIGESDTTKPISDYGKMLKYRENVSKSIYKSISTHTHYILQISCDELLTENEVLNEVQLDSHRNYNSIQVYLYRSTIVLH